MDLDPFRPALIAVAVGVLAALVTWPASRLARAVGRRKLPSLLVVGRTCRRPIAVTVVVVAVAVTLQTVSEVGDGWRRTSGVVVIGTLTWLLVTSLLATEQLVYGRLNTDIADNRRMRRARTQVTLLRRVLGAVVVLIGVAAILMSFPGMRAYGASLLASAGLAGIVAGLAAQTTLGNVVAGLQLAFTDAIRIDDVIVVEEEWGWVEEITLTYVVLHIWDERRMVLPTTYFMTTPFQNWTRSQSRILGSVILHLDYATPLEPLRQYARSVIEASPLWDRKDWVLQVADTTETTMVVRVLASAHDGPSEWDLRCDLREALLTWLQEHHPQSLPAHRVLMPPEPDRTPDLIGSARA